MATSTQNQALEEQRSRDLALAKVSTYAPGKAHDIAQAEALRSQITTNAQTANQASAANNTTTAPAAIDPATGYPYGSSGDTQALAQTTTTNTNNAVQSISSTLASLGLTGMSSWATSTISALVGKGIDPTTAVNTVLAEMNNPLNADGSVNQDALTAFNSALPGFYQLIANTGQNGSPGGSPAQAIATYISYEAQIQEFATQAGLAPGTISATDIGDLWANQSSTAEVSDRITEAVSNANFAAADPVIGSWLQSQGLSSSTLASYYINPTNTMQQLNTINTGVAGITTGFGEMSTAQAKSLAAFLTTPSANGVTAVTTQQAMGALTSNLAPGTSSAAGMAKAGFETALPGQPQGGPGVISGDALLGAVEGNATDTAAARLATGTRTAGTNGGGGAVNNQAGAQGVGFGSGD